MSDSSTRHQSKLNSLPCAAWAARKASAETGWRPRKVGTPSTNGQVGGQSLPAKSVCPGLMLLVASDVWSRQLPSSVLCTPENAVPNSPSAAKSSRRPNDAELRETA